MARATGALCTIYKNSDFTYEINYITIAVRYNNQWLFLKSDKPDGIKMISSHIKTNEPHEAAVRRELYNKAGIVAANVYEAAIYSVSVNQDKFRRNRATYGKLFFAECVCLGKNPSDNQPEIVLTEQAPTEAQFANPSVEYPLFRKVNCMQSLEEIKNCAPYSFEKLCGAVTYCNDGGIIKYILIKNLSGHIGFPKGHAENGENELETAKREVFEETGLYPLFDAKFRHSFTYTVPRQCHSTDKKTALHKTAVYFIGTFSAKDIANIKIQEEEVLNWWLVPYKEALRLLNKHTDRRLLTLANSRIEQIEKQSSRS